MRKVTTLFWDVGGVVLTNGWDASSRKAASQKFSFDFGDFETKHAKCEESFETGRISLDEYMEKTLFFKRRSFKKAELKSFIFSRSKPHRQTLEMVRRLAHSKKYQMAAMNNESLELNIYRIKKFHLQDYFTDFFSSCFLAARKPARQIYDKALQITQRKPTECLFIDDRQPNLEQARILGFSTIHYKGADQLRRELQRFLHHSSSRGGKS